MLRGLIAIATLAIAATALAAGREEDEEAAALKRRLEELEAQLEALSQSQARTEAALDEALGTLEGASESEQARTHRIETLDALIEAAAETDVALMSGRDTTSELLQMEAAFLELHAEAGRLSGRRESEAMLAAARSARGAIESLAERDWLRARFHVADLAEAAALARNTATGRTEPAWTQ